MNFSDIFIDDTKNVKRINSDEYLTKGSISVIDQGKELIAGYASDDVENACYDTRIIFGDHTRIFKYIDFPFVCGADGTKVLKIIDPSKINYKYMYYYLLASNIPNTGYNRHFKWVKELSFKPVDINSQMMIVNKLDKINNLIDCRKKEIEKCDNLIKSQFVEMFGDPIINEKNWVTDKINNVAPAKSYKGDFSSDRVWLLNLDMVESDTGRIIDYLYEDIGNIGNSTCCFSEDNVLYSKLRPYLNKVVIPYEKGFATSEMVPLYPDKNKLNRTFLTYLLRSNSFVDYISVKVSGAKMPRVIMEEFRKYKIILPPIELQNKFAQIVEQIDKQKFEFENSLKKLEELQASLMQEYFG